MRPHEIRQLIRSSGKIPCQRSTTYRIIKEYTDQTDEQDSSLDRADASQFGSYHQLVKLDKFRYVHKPQARADN